MEALLRTFDGVCEGPPALLLVGGYAGIGKTSLIQELYKPIVRQRGYFTAGKFDQGEFDVETLAASPDGPPTRSPPTCARRLAKASSCRARAAP